jgi:UDP:flavonoid glycosyltransferase YjiC (YdhE family)
MRVLLSTYGSRGDVEPMVGLAVQLRHSAQRDVMRSSRAA